VRPWSSISYALRSLRRAPGFSLAVVATLTIGIGSAAAIFAVVDAVLLRPLPYGHAEQLVGAWHDLPPIGLMKAQQTTGTFYTYQRLARTISGIAIYNDGSANVTDPDGRAQPERLSAAWVTANLFTVLQVKPMLGRAFTEAEDVKDGPLVAMISEGFWRSRYGSDPHILGRKLSLFERPTEIVGVMPASFTFPNATTKIWIPRRLDPKDPFPGGFNHSSIARLKPGVTVAEAERDFATVLPRMVDMFPSVAPGVTTQLLMDQAKPRPRLIPLRDDIVGDASKALWMVAAAALLVLLVTCANVANLLLVRADGRHRELSVRAALGAGRARVVAHFLTEAGVLAVISAGFGLAAATLALRGLVAAGPAQLPRLSEVGMDWRVMVFTLAVTVVVAVACSAIPAIRFLRGDALSGLREGGRAGTAGASRQRARGVLVAAQMAFALVALVASGLLLRSFQRLHAVRPGFNPDGVATVWVALPQMRYKNDTTVVRFYANVVERAKQLPGVTAFGLSSRLPLQSNGMDQDPMLVEGKWDPSKKIGALQMYSTADAGYFKAMGIQLVAGRTFDRMEVQRGDESIISTETAKTVFGDSTGASAIGKRFQILPHGAWHTIIGVVRSARDTSLSAPPTPAVYNPQSISPDTLYGPAWTLALVAKTTGDVVATTRSLQQLVHELDPALPTFDAKSMPATVSESLARLSFTMIMLGVAAGVTLALGVVGLYGVIAYIVTLRTRELGVRIALGAQPSSVAVMVARQGLVLSAAGIVAGVALLTLVGRFVRSFLFEVAPMDPGTITGAIALLALFALLASWIPARRASMVDPTEALRSD
jgi:putative ABC transport system permease protein